MIPGLLPQLYYGKLKSIPFLLNQLIQADVTVM
jgi:hypothetical protein